uniref:Uncharacterized protein n=1 Tax=Medicago truncatula TaxID=3880 RepID=I3SKP5_MEDTR|nr:unknown [Medicago truncatula]
MLLEKGTLYQLDGQNIFELNQEWQWKVLLMMGIVGENMVRKTSLEPCIQEAITDALIETF